MAFGTDAGFKPVDLPGARKIGWRPRVEVTAVCGMVIYILPFRAIRIATKIPATDTQTIAD